MASQSPQSKENRDNEAEVKDETPVKAEAPSSYSTPPRPAVLAWDEAVRTSCLQRKQLYCCVGDIVSDNTPQYILNLPDRLDNLTLDDIVRHLQEKHAATTSATASSSYFSLVGSVASAVVYGVLKSPEYVRKLVSADLDTDYEDDADDDDQYNNSVFNNDTTNDGSAMDNLMQVSWELCEAAFQLVRDTAAVSTETVVPVTEFRTWVLAQVDSSAPLAKLLQGLPPEHFQALQRVLALPQHADETNQQFYCFGGKDTEHAEARITLYKLDRAIAYNQNLLDASQRKSEMNLARARQTKQLAPYKQHLLYKQRVQKTEEILLNLATVHAAVVDQLGQRHIVGVLEEASHTLSNLRMDVETVDDLMDGLAEQASEAQMIQDTLATSHNDNTYSEDDLLAELQALSLGDEGATTQGGSGRMPAIPSSVTQPMATDSSSPKPTNTKPTDSSSSKPTNEAPFAVPST